PDETRRFGAHRTRCLYAGLTRARVGVSCIDDDGASRIASRKMLAADDDWSRAEAVLSEHARRPRSAGEHDAHDVIARPLLDARRRPERNPSDRQQRLGGRPTVIDRHAWRGLQPPVAVLVLFPRAAGARIVAPHLLASALEGPRSHGYRRVVGCPGQRLVVAGVL